MYTVCLFDGGEAGRLVAETVPPERTTLPFMPYRSPAHRQLCHAVQRDGAAVVELRGGRVHATRTVVALTAEAVTFGPAE